MPCCRVFLVPTVLAGNHPLVSAPPGSAQHKLSRAAKEVRRMPVSACCAQCLKAAATRHAQ